MLVGETQQSNMGSCRLHIHHNLRVAHVSQHAFFHVEHHLEDAPAAYIQWWFKEGFDKEKINSDTFRITEEEQKAINDFGLEAIWSRRLRAGVLENFPCVLPNRLGIGVGTCSNVLERLYIDVGKVVDTLVYQTSEVGCLGPGIDEGEYFVVSTGA